MANFAKMTEATFKKQIHALPDDPTARADFYSFVAEHKDNASNVDFGFYVGELMKTEYKKHRDASHKPALYLGLIGRSAKFPKKRLVVALTKPTTLVSPQQQQLKLLGKQVMKACQLPLTIVFVQSGDAEPELGADEIAFHQAADAAALAAARASGAPQRALPATPPPTAAQPAEPAPAPFGRPDAESPTDARDPVEYRRFRLRLSNMSEELRHVPALLEKVPEADAMAKLNVAKAHLVLDAFERKLEESAASNPPVKVAGTLRRMWNVIEAEGLSNSAVLRVRSQAVQDALKLDDLPEAARLLHILAQDVQTQKVERDKKIRNALFRSPNYAADIDVDVIGKDVAAALKVPEPLARELLKPQIEALRGQAVALVPKGAAFRRNAWNPKLSLVNPLLPAESRPVLTVDEAVAVNEYSDEAYKEINRFLRDGAPPLDAAHQAIFEGLQSTFRKLQPFARPLLVSRGMYFKPEDSRKMQAFLDKCDRSWKQGQGFSLECFASTGTAGVPMAFDGQIMLCIVAKAGLDLQPYTKTPKERELLLDAATLVVVRDMAQEGTVWKITLEQQLREVAPGRPVARPQGTPPTDGNR